MFDKFIDNLIKGLTIVSLVLTIIDKTKRYTHRGREKSPLFLVQSMRYLYFITS